MNWQQDYNRLHPGTRVRWNGFTSTLHELISMGWDAQVIKESNRYSARLILKLISQDNNNRVIGTGTYTKDFWYRLFENKDLYKPNHFDFEFNMQTSIQIVIAENINLTVLGDSYRGNRATPAQLSTIDTRTMDFVDLSMLMSPNAVESKEIVVEKRPEIIDLLNQITDLQEPRARDLLRKERNAGKVESFEQTANIIQLRG